MVYTDDVMWYIQIT